MSSLLDKNSPQSIIDLFFMKEALKEAKKAFDAKEVPVGSVAVYNNKIVARAYNQVELLKDATAHSEMLSIGAASSYFNNFRLKDVTIYSTLEPCPMCASAMFLARIKRLVYSAKDIRLGANGSFVDLFSVKHPLHSIEVTDGILAEVSSQLMKEFFQKVRNEKRNSNSKHN